MIVWEVGRCRVRLCFFFFFHKTLLSLYAQQPNNEGRDLVFSWFRWFLNKWMISTCGYLLKIIYVFLSHCIFLLPFFVLYYFILWLIWHYIPFGYFSLIVCRGTLCILISWTNFYVNIIYIYAITCIYNQQRNLVSIYISRKFFIFMSPFTCSNIYNVN